jgi:pSer/pThr/pTyr-binding forkhead associated (FHA) protein
MLALRLAFIGLLYLFLWQIVRLTGRELLALAKLDEARATGARTGGKLVLIDPAASDLAPGMTFPLARRTVIGRHPTCEVVIDEPYVSGEHAELTTSSGQWFLRDLSSTNGTYINGEPCQAYADIHPGDVVQCGRVTFEFLP